MLVVSVAATGNGGGCVLASATAHVAESQQTPSLYYHPSPAYKQVLYRTISNSKRILILLGKYSRRFQNPRVTFGVDCGQTCGLVSTLHHRSSGTWGRIGGLLLVGLDRMDRLGELPEGGKVNA